jgi:hypothetical protein
MMFIICFTCYRLHKQTADILKERNTAVLPIFSYEIFRRYSSLFCFLWLYSPMLGLGRLRETFRFISVTRSRTVGRAPWTSDQVVARPLSVCPAWLWGRRSWWNERFWQGKPKYSEKTCPDATLSTTNPTSQARARTRSAAVGNQRLTASAMEAAPSFL